MKIALCETVNGTNRIICELVKKQYKEVVVINNNDFELGVVQLRKQLTDVEVVFNLTGNKYTKRWNTKRKERINYTRVEYIKLLTKAINGMENPPQLFLMTTLANIYDNLDVHDEFSLSFNDDFLADICKNWEKEAFKLNQKTRLCIFRTGFVLSDKGGIYPKVKRLLKLNLGGKVGTGKQSVPFVHVNDVLKAFEWCISNNDKKGIYNLVAPEILSNDELLGRLLEKYKRFKFASYPHFFLKLIYGEASIVFESGQCVIPQRLLSDGFEFECPTFEKCLENL